MFRKRNRKMQCGFCTLLSNLLRSFMCIGSRRGSTESYYREIGDQDTLRPEDRSSHGSINELVTICRPILPATCQKRRFHPEVEQMPEKGRVTGRFMTVNRRRKRQLQHLAGDVALNDDFVLGHVKKYLTATIQWEFNAFALENVTEGKCLAVLCVHLFHSYGLMQHFNMDAERVWKLFSLIEEGYHSSNPYHNAIHAADVTQAMHCFLQENRIREHMEPIELMSSLLAAIAHDLDHPGVSQPFLIATNNYLARLYDNTSVLENHHWRTAVSCVLESRVLVNVMSDDVCDTLVRQVSSLILATDITRQQDYLSHFKNHLDSNSLDMTQAEHRHMVMQIALKCADISNPCRPWEISKKWSLKVCEEFFRQGDYERELNLPITALCDRYTNSIPTIQTGFLKFVVLPLMTEWHRFLGSDLSKQMMKHLDYNQKMWEKLMAEEIKQEAKAPPKTVSPPENKMKPVEEIEEEDESGSVSDSNERLLPLRRRSLTTKKRLKKQIRRFSVPLNLFDAYKKDKRDPKTPEPTTKTEEANEKPKVDAKNMSLNLSEICEPGNSEGDEIVQAGQLRPDCKITCMTSPELASRLHAIKQGIKHKIIRQLTFPPLEAPATRLSPQSRSLFKSAESGMGRSEVSTLNKMVKEISVIETTIFGIMEAAKTEEVEATDEATEEKEFLRKFWLASGYARRRESAPIGSQLRDNLTAVKLTGIASDPQLQRRKSMPTDAILLPHEPKEFQVSSVLPDLLRTLSGKDTLTRRRGSAPVPAVASELVGRRGSRRNHVSCKASFPEAYHFHRRSSLPVEVMAGVSSH